MARRAQKTAADTAPTPQADTAVGYAENPSGPADPFSDVDISGSESEAGLPGVLVQTPPDINLRSETTREAGPGRGWTQRFEQPVAYRRFTLKDEHGAEKILFTFNLPAGQAKPDEEVIDVMRDHKFWKDGKPYGLAEDARHSDESYSTGLRFGSNTKFPKAWVLPSNPLGREVADSIDRALDGVAKKLAGQPVPEVA